MKDRFLLTRVQLLMLLILRILIGWHLLFEGFSKVAMTDWSAAGFLKESQWILSGFSQWVLSNNSMLEVVNFLNTWGLMAIGVGLILGLFAKVASMAGAILLLIYYLINPPLIGLEYSFPIEGSCLIVNKVLIEAIALFVLAVLPTSNVIGLDLLFKKGNREIS